MEGAFLRGVHEGKPCTSIDLDCYMYCMLSHLGFVCEDNMSLQPFRFNSCENLSCLLTSNKFPFLSSLLCRHLELRTRLGKTIIQRAPLPFDVCKSPTRHSSVHQQRFVHEHMHTDRVHERMLKERVLKHSNGNGTM